MDSWRIKHRLLALTLLPAVLVGVVLTVYWTAIKIQHIDEDMVARGNTIVGFLAPAAEYGVISGNRSFLRSASRRVRDEPNLISIRISDGSGNLLYTYVQDPQPSGRLHGLSAMLFGHDIRHFEAPITLSSLEDFERIAGFGEREAEPARVIGHVTVSLSTIPTAVAQTEWILRSVAIIVVLLSITTIVIYRLERSLSLPLEAMVETVHRIGRGDLQARADVHGGGELGVLADGINNMADNIQRAQTRMAERIQSATDDLQGQIRLIDQKNRELTIARAEADEANLKKSQLLASISHELRTPLSAIQGYTELLAQHGRLNEQEQGWLAVINTSSRDTLKLVNDLLDVSRLESGRISIHRSQFDLGQCLSEVIGICRRSSYGSTVDVTLIMDPETPTCISTDKLRFKQVVTNILSNALNYTRDGRVSVHAGLRESEGRRQLELCVRDNGPGIDPEDLPHIFEPFYQSRNPATAGHSGAGLGLGITRGIVQLLGGQILVDSAPDAGSLFTIVLPLTDSDVPLPSPPLPNSVGEVAVWCEESDIRRALLQCLRVMHLAVHSCRDLNEYLTHLRRHSRSVGVIWVRALPPEDVEALHRHGPEMARTLLTRSVALGEETAGKVSTLGAHLIPLTLSVAALNQAIQALVHTGRGGAKKAKKTDTDTTSPRLAGRRFLVADDNAVNRRLLSEFIRRHGGLVKQVEDGNAAVRAYAESQPDLVFMDVHMPGKDGIAALEEIRGADPSARIVAVTADLRPETHIALLQHGFDHVLYKPISERDLLGCVEDAPPKKRTRRSRGGARNTGQPVHDEATALERAGSNPQLARDMLQMLLGDVERVSQQMRDQAPGRDALLELVHRIHGGARYCGTLRLAARSQALESAIRDGVEEPLAELEAAWIEEMDTLLAQRDALLASLQRRVAGSGG
jgi:two-component system, NarL family, sensor histidine kinase BarA